MGLPEEYKVTVMGLMTGEDAQKLTFAGVLPRLLAAKSELKVTERASTTSALAMSYQPRGGGNQRPVPGVRRCHECGSLDHLKRDCPKLKGANGDEAKMFKMFQKFMAQLGAEEDEQPRVGHDGRRNHFVM